MSKSVASVVIAAFVCLTVVFIVWTLTPRPDPCPAGTSRLENQTCVTQAYADFINCLDELRLTDVARYAEKRVGGDKGNARLEISVGADISEKFANLGDEASQRALTRCVGSFQDTTEKTLGKELNQAASLTETPSTETHSLTTIERRPLVPTATDVAASPPSSGPPVGPKQNSKATSKPKADPTTPPGPSSTATPSTEAPAPSVEAVVPAPTPSLPNKPYADKLGDVTINQDAVRACLGSDDNLAIVRITFQSHGSSPGTVQNIDVTRPSDAQTMQCIEDALRDGTTAPFTDNFWRITEIIHKH